jgi:hypothetical protein
MGYEKVLSIKTESSQLARVRSQFRGHPSSSQAPRVRLHPTGL